MPKFLACLTLYFFCASNVLSQTLLINEVVSNSFSGFLDEDGDESDWIEIHNAGNIAVHLQNKGLSDDLEEPFKWVLPEIELNPGEFLVIFASGKDRNEGELHTNFKLNSEGENLRLVSDDGSIIDENLDFKCTESRSWGRLPDGGQWSTLEHPSFATSNNINDIAFSSESPGFYEEEFDVLLSSIMGDSIYYTLNGDEPTLESSLYAGPLTIEDKDLQANYFCNFPTTPGVETNYNLWQAPNELIDKAMVLRFCTFRNGLRTSRIETRTYFIRDDFSLPVLSITGNEEGFFSDESGIYVPGSSFDPDVPANSGNYFLTGDNWEREIHLELFDEAGILVLASNCGVRIHGGSSRVSALKSMKFYARSKYGDKYFDYRLMPASQNDKYKRFTIRSPMSDGGNTIIKDEVAHELSEDLNFPNQNSQPVVVFLNGEYWGIQTIRDRIDKYFLEYEEGAHRDSVNLVRGGSGLLAEEGSADDMLELRAWIEENDLTDDGNFAYVESKIDIENYIDYCIAEMFFANYDWPGNNVRLWSSTEEDSRWRWIFYDLDGGLGNYEYNMFEHCMVPDPDDNWPNGVVATFMFRNLIKNNGFLIRFTERWATILSTYFVAQQLQTTISKIKNKYETEMPKHIQRWNYPQSMDQWENDVNSIIGKFLAQRPCMIEQQIIDSFSLDEFGFSCSSISPSRPLLLYPNPNHGEFQILNNSHSTNGDILIYDLSGQIQYQEDRVGLEALGLHQISAGHLSKGLYTLNFTGLDFCQIMKFIVE